ncbi:protein phosphatase 1 regulatory subunit 42-like isoform X2 [Mizuhopecten yessoensis]|uniref:Protein phosphatase 1 regulatory subunit 42 n=1 Tax=Mizuhopecten yessoensis TaxID=6573 RepID=A0A210R0A2_MIZYE|nr:protein phosphatase 1 regulatory subunit 42-like isoform X2 [Mizuhopecten yessoensis]OWF54404.1 Protein phosphatase 1 regulatory subunit 42 [Mizuhopecten yessoensis]
MVKLTLDLIARGTSGYTKKKRDESMQQYLKRLTHLYLEDRSIDDVGDDIGMCRNLTVLYLYDNQLNRIPSLHHNMNLTMLYLQNNDICKVENLAPLTRLQKLYLGGNCITVLEGLDKMDKLQELHVENQRLPPGEKLLFDPRSLRGIALSLQVLNVSGNGLDSIRDMIGLRNVSQFMANDNELSDMKDLAHNFGNWPVLWRLELMGNPVCHKAKYRDRIIVMAKTLEVLDGKEITETSRQFLRKWHANKETQKKKRDEIYQRSAYTDLGDGHQRSSELPPVKDPTRPVKSSQIPGYMMPGFEARRSAKKHRSGLPRKQFDELLARTATMEPPSREKQPTPVKAKSGVLRSKQADEFATLPPSSSTVASAPLRRRPLMSMTFELSGNLDSTQHIHSGMIIH